MVFFSNSTSVINCSDTNAPSELSYLTASLSGVFFFIIVSGNLLIVIAIIKDPYHDLKKPFMKMVGNLALADLIVGLVVTPVSLAHHVMEGMNAEVSLWLLRVLHLSYFISCTASLLCITAIALDRHIAIAFPLHYKSTYLKRNPVKCYALIWFVAFGLPFLYLKVGYIKYAFVFGNIAIITAILFLFSSLYIIRKLSQRHKDQTTSGPSGEQIQRYSTGVEKRLTKVFSLILAAYLICYFPSCSIIYIMNLCTSCGCETIHWLRDMQFVLVLLNSCINPFLYAWQIKGFRKAFRIIVGSFLKRSSSSYRVPTSSDGKGGKRENKELTSEQKVVQNEKGIVQFNVTELALQ